MTVKFCRDCKWAKVSWLSRLLGQWRYATCTHPALRNDLRTRDANADFQVTGRMPTVTGDAYLYCSVNRRYDCGSEGNFWEPRKTTGAPS